MSTPGTDAGAQPPASKSPAQRGLLLLGALGIVYGDIGTSPIYAMREAFTGPRAAPLTDAGILGVVSLVIWSLIAVVSIKYLLVVMRADDQGEGGIIALEALATRSSQRRQGVVRVLSVLGLFGTALLYGDGMITPAISVLSAVEGIDVIRPGTQGVVVPAAVTILIVLFAFQRRGTAQIGVAFGPVMLLWFAFLALAGLRQLVQSPEMLQALNPLLGVAHLTSGGFAPVFTLGSVFLVVTGAEALYADMGHFGRGPIARNWTVLVFPALALQYLGQGALLMRDPGAAEHLFYEMVPGSLLPFVVGLTTLATIIASQALISGAFSLTAQAAQLGYLPRLRVQHTSDHEVGQVYVPAVNWFLMIAAIALVVGFQSSTRLASAYGVAVVLTMIITTILFYVVSRDRLDWPRWRSVAVCSGFLAVDLAFLVANVDKVPSGGWFPLVVGGGLYLLMRTWIDGRKLVARQTRSHLVPTTEFVNQLRHSEVTRVPGGAVYLFGIEGVVPPALLINLRRNHIVHQSVAIVTVLAERRARVPQARRATVTELDGGFVQIVLRFGFSEEPDVPAALANIVDADFGLVPNDVAYIVGTDDIIATPGDGLALWRERLYVTLRRNSTRSSAYFCLPADRVIQVGRPVRI